MHESYIEYPAAAQGVNTRVKQFKSCLRVLQTPAVTAKLMVLEQAASPDHDCLRVMGETWFRWQAQSMHKDKTGPAQLIHTSVAQPAAHELPVLPAVAWLPSQLQPQLLQLGAACTQSAP